MFRFSLDPNGHGRGRRAETQTEREHCPSVRVEHKWLRDTTSEEILVKVELITQTSYTFTSMLLQHYVEETWIVYLYGLVLSQHVIRMS